MPRLLAIILLFAASAVAAPPTASIVPLAAQPSAHFDAQAATEAWLATVPAEQRANSDAYFEGGYWLILWDFLYTAGVMLILLETKLSARMRDWAQRVSMRRPIRSFLYWLQFFLLSALLTFPLTVYEGFFREHKFGLSNQAFGAWFNEQLIGLALGAVFGGLAFMALVAVVIRLPRTWPFWGAAVSIAFLTLGVVISPVFIAPLFNTYTPLKNPVIKNQILSVARENGIPATDVYEQDASKQSKRVSANVSGIFGTDRITLNDNLLQRCSPPAILATMGHEMGHYVLHHIYSGLIFSIPVLLAMFTLLRWGMQQSLSLWGHRWRVHQVTDIAALPVAVLLLTIFSFVLTPLTNSFTRTQEYEADIFGLNAARQPDGEAEVDLLLGEYRKLSPSPLEEFIFFDHPSGRVRIFAAMRWKAENLCLFDASLPCRIQSHP